MPRDASLTRGRILKAAHQAFFRRGFSRVKMSDIAKAAGLTKRTLYQHFDSKDSLLEAMLEHQHEQSERTFATTFSHEEGSPEALVARLYDDIAVWSARKDFAGAGFTRLACELADLRGHPAMRLARRHKATMEDRLARNLAAQGLAGAEALARELMMLMEGAILMLLLHRDRAYAEAAEDAARALIARARATTSAPPLS